MDSYQVINDVLVNLFRDIMDIEQRAVTCQAFPSQREAEVPMNGTPVSTGR